MATNINTYLFSNASDREKLEVIKRLTQSEVRATTESTILRILRECKPSDYDRWHISSDRRVGNHWNSEIEFIYEYGGRPYIMFYVQNTKTDSSDSVPFSRFNCADGYRGYCDNIGSYYTYDSDEVVEVIRCILAEYVWWHIETPKRERGKMLASITHWSIVNPVANYFYDELRLKYVPTHVSSPKRDAYYRGQKAMQKYAEEHLDELFGKPKEELIAIYKRVFRDAM